MEQEIWKPVKDWENKYKVSNLGRVMNIETGTIRKLTRTKKGYERICFRRNNTMYNVRIHRLVGEAFIDNPLGKPQINHKNEIKSDNRVTNLEWCTDEENKLHSGRRANAPRAINQISLKGNFIREWDTIHEAMKFMKNNHIPEVLKNKRNSAAGYKWEYK